jgi:hypothetical protein
LHGEAALQEQYLLFWQGFCCGLRSSSFGGGRGPLGALSSRARASCCRGRTIGGGLGGGARQGFERVQLRLLDAGEDGQGIQIQNVSVSFLSSAAAFALGLGAAGPSFEGL